MSMKRILILAGLIAVGIGANASRGYAQYGGYRSSNDIFRDATIRSPTVSPYLNLFTNSSSATPNYYSYVKPLLEQERDNRRQTERVAQLQQDLNQTSARLNSEQQQRQGIRPTGHQTAFMNYLHYFRGPQQQQPGFRR
jgi:hypothetical protein